MTAPWVQVGSTELALRALADRHSSRQSPGTVGFNQNSRRVCFMVPGGRLEWVATIPGPHAAARGVGVTAEQVQVARAGWVTSWPQSQYVGHAWADSWLNSFFRNESDLLASDLIVAAIRSTLEVWPEPPKGGIVTFIDAKKVQHNRSGVGRVYKLAGFAHIGQTKMGLEVFQMVPEAIKELA